MRRFAPSLPSCRLYAAYTKVFWGIRDVPNGNDQSYSSLKKTIKQNRSQNQSEEKSWDLGISADGEDKYQRRIIAMS